MSTEQTYRRVTIQGELTTLSDMHLGSGETGERGEGTEAIQVNELASDCMGRPIIPGSSLRGFLSARFQPDDPHFLELFGIARKDGSERAGVLRVSDGWLVEDHRKEIVRSRIAVDPVTRTAEENKLFTDILTPRGSRFRVDMSLDDVSESALAALLQALASLNRSNPTAQLGQGKSHGRGLLEWRSDSVKALTQPAFETWLTSEEPLDKAQWQAITPPTDADPNQWQVVQLRYHFDAPVLINDPSIVSGEKTEPDLRFMRRGDQLLIPGSSIKGLFRARARRILMTLRDDENIVDRLLDEMFGGEEGMGVLRFYDLTATTETHKQTLIAVDRFSGGVKSGAMLNLEAARPEAANTTVALHRKKKLQPWQQGLWLYLLRDAMEGDLALGWGQARGFGAFHVELQSSQGGYLEWPAYWQDLDKTEVQQWTEALTQELEKEARP